MTISYANLDGSGGGDLDITGATIAGPHGLAIDPTDGPYGTLYWPNHDMEGEMGSSISRVRLNGTGTGGVGEDLPITNATLDEPRGMMIDPVTEPHLLGELRRRRRQDDLLREPRRLRQRRPDRRHRRDRGTADGPRGHRDRPGDPEDLLVRLRPKAPDPVRQHRRNRRLGPEHGRRGDARRPRGRDRPRRRSGSTGPTGTRTASPGRTSTAPAAATWSSTSRPRRSAGPTSRRLLKQPAATAPPTVSGGSEPGAKLTCSPGTWAGDVIESLMYRAPQGASSYRWTLDGANLPGSSGTSITATVEGKYRCLMTAGNAAGSTTQASAAHAVKATPPTAALERVHVRQGQAQPDPRDRQGRRRAARPRGREDLRQPSAAVQQAPGGAGGGVAEGQAARQDEAHPATPRQGDRAPPGHLHADRRGCQHLERAGRADREAEDQALIAAPPGRRAASVRPSD